MGITNKTCKLEDEILELMVMFLKCIEFLYFYAINVCWRIVEQLKFCINLLEIKWKSRLSIQWSLEKVDVFLLMRRNYDKQFLFNIQIYDNYDLACDRKLQYHVKPIWNTTKNIKMSNYVFTSEVPIIIFHFFCPF